MTRSYNFDFGTVSLPVDPASPLSEELTMVSKAFHYHFRDVSSQGMEAIERDEEFLVAAIGIVLRALTAVVGTVAANLPVPQQHAFMSECGVPDDMAEGVLAHIRQQMAQRGGTV